MKNLVFSFLATGFVSFTHAQIDSVIMEINGIPVLKSEFLQVYLKNNAQPKYDKASLDEYMELFKKFKLKVAEAERLKYDTLPKLKKEFEAYKKQLALPYLIDSVQNKALVREAYERTKTEIRASHILITLENNASPQDTLAAWNKITALKRRIENGEDFAVVARGKNGSEDPSVENNGGDLGYFTAFQMVYPFEDRSYNTPTGTVSDPFRTRFGYHIVKVTDRRPARGTIKTAHIMVALGKNATPETAVNAEKKINEIYDKLVAGEKFEVLAKTYSDDPSSNQRGGELPAFGTGTSTRMVPVFEDVAFALANNGDFSKPVKTDYGYHIIKRMEWTDVKSFDELKKELQGRVNKDERSKKTQDAFVAKLKINYGFENTSNKSIKWFIKHLDTTFYFGRWKADGLRSDRALFTLDGKSFGQQDFARYIETNYRGVRRDKNDVVIRQLYKNWEKERILGYEESKLASKYPEYKALVAEYHDGILLYEIMQDKIWNKAIKDTTGLQSFFASNRKNYLWGKRADVVVYECSDRKIADKVYKMIQNDTINSKHVLDEINKDSELNLRVKMNKFEIENTPYLKGRSLTKGVNLPYDFEGKLYVLKVNDLIDPKPKEFSEAKGLITSDYQNYLEKIWLNELSEKHPIKINYSVLYSLGK